VSVPVLLAPEDLKVEGIDVIHLGRHTFPLADRIRAVALQDLSSALPPL